MLYALMLSTLPASACSCASAWTPDAAHCATSPRVFAATVSELHGPQGMAAILDPTPATVVMHVERVYRGEVAPTLTTAVSAHPGGCGRPLAPGTPVFVCDAGQPSDGPTLSLCHSPATHDHAVHLEAELILRDIGAPTAPTAPPERWPRIAPLLLSYLLSPWLLLLLGGLAGRWAAKPHTLPNARRLRSGRVVAGIAACGLFLRLVGHLAVKGGEGYAWGLLGPGVALWAAAAGTSFVLGLLLGGHRVRRTGVSLGVAAAAGPGLLLLAHMPLVLPIDRSDAVTCSVDRARTLLAEPGPLSQAVAAHSRACTWWGTVSFEITRSSKWVQGGCLRFSDARRQRWTVCPQTAAQGGFPLHHTFWN